MWKYIEDRDEAGEVVDEKRAAAFFGVRDPECPVITLEDGWIAVWCAGPLKKPSDYPQLSRRPVGGAADVFPHVGG